MLQLREQGAPRDRQFALPPDSYGCFYGNNTKNNSRISLAFIMKERICFVQICQLGARRSLMFNF